MSEEFPEQLAGRVRKTASAFPYPSTPDIAAAVTRRIASEAPRGPRPHVLRPRLAWAAGAAAVLLAGLLAVPQVRAAIVEIIRIGVVTIFVDTSTPTPESIVTAIPVTAAPQVVVVTSTPRPSWAPPRSLLESLAGEMTLEAAQAKVAFKILLPTYPADLGPPDRVFVQDQGGQVAILVWTDPDDPGYARMSLHQLPPESWGIEKVGVTALQVASVNGLPAVWAEGPYILIYRDGDLVEQRLVDGHVLIWEQDGITYRLESDLPLAEALKIAESLR
jgi:hypothetical protein